MKNVNKSLSKREKRMERNKNCMVFTILFIGLLSFSSSTYAQNSGFVAAQDNTACETNWNYDYIQNVPPIMMRDPLIEMLGQTNDPIPYYYEEAVKITGHSCQVVASAWMITRLALEQLYPNGEVPVRGQIKIEMPGAEDEWNIGVYGEVMAYVTGATTKNGFSGSVFAKGNPLTIRRNKMVYTENPVGTPPPKMKWIFTRLDNNKSVTGSWNITLVQPKTDEKVLKEIGNKVASGTATPEELAEFHKNWNAAAVFILENAETVDGLITIGTLEDQTDK